MKLVRVGLLAIILITVVLLVVPTNVYADQVVEVSITTNENFVGTTYSSPKSYTVDVSKISQAKQVFIEITVKSVDDLYLRILYVQIDGAGVNEKVFKETQKMTAIVAPNSQNLLKYDVTNMVKGKNSVNVNIYLYNLAAKPYTWTVSAKFIGVLSDDIVITDPSNPANSFAIPVYMASGLGGVGLLGVAYYLKQRED